MHPYLIQIGGFSVPTYGVLVALGMAAALWITTKLAKRDGLKPDVVANLAIYCAFAGIIGAKLFMFLFDWREYWANPSEIFSRATLQAAGVFQGGLLLALIVAYFYMKMMGLPWLRTADVFAPGISLGHAIGRLGCLMAGCCFGRECSMPWAITFHNEAARALSDTPINVPLHPTQLYESIGDLAIFAFLYWRNGKAHRPGEIIGLYLALYSALRIVVEFFRFHEQNTVVGLSLTQWISAAFLLAGCWLLWQTSQMRWVSSSTASKRSR